MFGALAFLVDGRIVERGTHEELIAAGGRYRTMIEMQMGLAQTAKMPSFDAGESQVRADVGRVRAEVIELAAKVAPPLPAPPQGSWPVPDESEAPPDTTPAPADTAGG